MCSGTFTFKGSDRFVPMVFFVLEDLAPRRSRFPFDPPRGKGQRICKATEEVGDALIKLPAVVLDFRSRYLVGVSVYCTMQDSNV